MCKNDQSPVPLCCDWKIKTSEEAEQITGLSGPFQKIKATMETIEEPEGRTVFGWICEYRDSYMFIEHDTQTPCDPEKCWFENVQPL